MRTSLSILTLLVSLVACDVSKSVGDEGSSTSGADSSAPDTEGASTTTPATASSTTAGSATSSPGGGSVTTASATTGTMACQEFDPGPVGDPDFSYSWECYCQTCELSYPDIPLETVELFDEGGLCDCLCAESGCGFAEGEGGVGGGPETGGQPDTDTFGTGSSGWPDTDGGTSEGQALLTVGACLDDGGEVVGDPGDGSVFEPDYVCPSGESPLGILDFEPGMPFPKNGGVCCL